MREAINPRVDIAFKKIFGVEENKDLLISLVNSIVSSVDQVDQVQLLNPYNERNFKKDKLSVVDIKARNKLDGTYFLIEMQLAEEVEYHKRGLYSWARIYANQLASGDQYKLLNKVIAIHILNFTFIDYSKIAGWEQSAPNKYHHVFVLIDKETGVKVFKDIEIHTLELNKFEAIDSQDLKFVMTKVKSMLDQWVAVLTKYSLLSIGDLPKEMNMPEIGKALEVINEMSMSRDERDIYNAHLDFLRIEAGAFEARFEAGKEEGKVLGIEEGKVLGIEEGKVLGIEEGKIKLACNLLNEGWDIEVIAKATELSVDEIKKYNKREFE